MKSIRSQLSIKSVMRDEDEMQDFYFDHHLFLSTCSSSTIFIDYYYFLLRYFQPMRKISDCRGWSASLSVYDSNSPRIFLNSRIWGHESSTCSKTRFSLTHRANLLAQRTVATTNDASRAMIDGQTERSEQNTVLYYRVPYSTNQMARSVIEFDFYFDSFIRYCWNDRSNVALRI